jgi:hypothetical protein
VAATIGQQWQTAEGHFHEALNVATRLGTNPELGLTCLNYAQMLVKRGAEGDIGEAISRLQTARVTFTELGMSSYAGKVETLSDAIHNSSRTY